MKILVKLIIFVNYFCKKLHISLGLIGFLVKMRLLVLAALVSVALAKHLRVYESDDVEWENFKVCTYITART